MNGYGNDYRIQDDHLYKRSAPNHEFVDMELATFAQFYFVQSQHSNENGRTLRLETRCNSLTEAREKYDEVLKDWYKKGFMDRPAPKLIDEHNKNYKYWTDKETLERLQRNIEDGIRRIELDL